jgi:hypothetical protein
MSRETTGLVAGDVAWRRRGAGAVVRSLAALAGLAIGPPPPACAAPPPALAPLEFLLGDWRAEGGGPGMGAGEFTFARDLQDRVLVRRSSAATTAPDGSASRHEDLMIVYAADAGEVRADYFDNEGHVVRYEVTTTAGKEAVFLSRPAADAGGFRLKYSLGPDGTLRGSFEIAVPGRPDQFAPYLAWTARRASDAAAPLRKD